MSLRGIVAKSQEMHSTKKMQNNTALLTHCPTPIIFLYFNSKRFVPIHVGNAVLEGLIYTMVLQVPSLIQDKALENELQARMHVCVIHSLQTHSATSTKSTTYTRVERLCMPFEH